MLTEYTQVYETSNKSKTLLLKVSHKPEWITHAYLTALDVLELIFTTAVRQEQQQPERLSVSDCGSLVWWK